MITIFGTTYFTIGAGFVVLVLAAPFLFWFSRWLWLPNVEGKPRRVRSLAIGGTTLALLLLLAVGLFWDVYLIGQRAKELCQETGLVVLRKVSTDSLAGLTSIQSYQAAGISYVEDEVQGRLYRFSIQNGRLRKDPISGFSSRYQVVSRTDAPPSENGVTGNRISEHVEKIIDRSSGETLGTLKDVSIHAGWFDSILFSITGFTYTPWTCGRTSDGLLVFGPERMSHYALVRAVINTPNDPRRDRNGHEQHLPEGTVR